MKKTFPKVLGVGRMADNPKALLVCLADAPTDDELRFFHDYLSSWTCAARPWERRDPPQECNWPMCGCDPSADRVIEALEEAGALKSN